MNARHNSPFQKDLTTTEALAMKNPLPCPFCGQTEIIVSWYEFRGDGPEQFPQDVVCSTTDCPAGFCGQDFKGKGTDAVIAAWNRRPSLTTATEA